MDIAIKNDNSIFKYRVNGIIIKENKILTVQIMDNALYCCPGGHIKIGESGIQAIKREMLEELNIEIEVDRPLAFIENFFTRKNGEKIHEISLYYMVNPINEINKNNWTIIEQEDNIDKKLEFKWIALDELNDVNFQPQILIDQLKDKDFNFKFYSIGK